MTQETCRSSTTPLGLSPPPLMKTLKQHYCYLQQAQELPLFFLLKATEPDIPEYIFAFYMKDMTFNNRWLINANRFKKLGVSPPPDKKATVAKIIW